MALRTPPLRGVHAERGASFTEFGGWDMPVEFDSIRSEHAAVRGAAGVFDVSHMGEIVVSGPDATALMDRLTTNDVAGLDPGEAQYSAITDEEGVMLDDTVVYRLPDGDLPGTALSDAAAEAGAAYLFVPNAGGDEEAHDRWRRHRDEWGLDAVVDNATDEYAMLALQGPDAVAVGDDLADGDLAALDWFDATAGAVAGVDALVSRSGYTGEDGLELILPWGEAEPVWRALTGDPDPGNGEDEEGGVTDGDGAGVQPCGLGARDTLRIEAGLLLSGQDFDAESDPRTPFEAGIGFVVDLDTEFVGRDALAAVEEAGVDERFVGLELLDRGVPRHGYDVVNTDNRVIGTVTSGTVSPTLDRPIGTAYLPVDYADPGTTVRVVVRGDQKEARTERLPFYRRDE
ncbi:MAG: glycine cleavage system aminomethyltransferase GcvT [Haloarculaceae archaeon]